jgi:hypothetical protein
MVEFKIKVHPQQRLAYIPKEIVDALGIRLRAVPNLSGIFVYPENLPPEQALNSMKAIYRHFKQETEIKRKTALRDQHKNETESSK